jgi:MFS family permease
MFLFFQALYLEQLGADIVQIGAILGAMGVAMAVAQAPAGWLGDRIGSRPVMWSSWVLGAIATVIMALAGSLPGFVAGMLIYGLTSFVVAPMNAYITSVRGEWSVQRALTFVSAMFHLGAALGPVLGGWVGSTLGLQANFRFAAGFFVFSTAIVFLAQRPPVEQHSEHHARQPNLLKNPRFAGLLALIVLTMLGLYLAQPLSANYLQNVQRLTVQQIGWLGTANSLGNALLMLGFGFLKAPLGFLLGQGLVGLFVLFMWQGNHWVWFALAYFFFGGYRLARSMALTYARSLVKLSEMGLAFGLVETGNAIAAIVAPVIASLIYTHNPRLVYVVGLGLISVMMAVNLALLPGRQPDTQTPVSSQALYPDE